MVTLIIGYISKQSFSLKKIEFTEYGEFVYYSLYLAILYVVRIFPGIEKYLIFWRQKYKMIQLLWKTVWQLLVKLNIFLTYDPVTQLL